MSGSCPSFREPPRGCDRDHRRPSRISTDPKVRALRQEWCIVGVLARGNKGDDDRTGTGGRGARRLPRRVHDAAGSSSPTDGWSNWCRPSRGSRLECIGNSDALYHNVEHTMLVTLAGHDIMRGRALQSHMTASDYAHVIIACLTHDIGYVRGIFDGDGADGFVVGPRGQEGEAAARRFGRVAPAVPRRSRRSSSSRTASRASSSSTRRGSPRPWKARGSRARCRPTPTRSAKRRASCAPPT